MYGQKGSLNPSLSSPLQSLEAHPSQVADKADNMKFTGTFCTPERHSKRKEGIVITTTTPTPYRVGNIHRTIDISRHKKKEGTKGKKPL